MDRVKEEWRQCEEAPLYEVSNLGRVRRGIQGRGSTKGRILRQTTNADGYKCVTLGLGVKGKRRGFLVSRLVCAAFRGPPPSPVHQAAHADGVRDNNNFRNLRWALPSENNADKVLHGTEMRGEDHPNTILTEDKVRAIRLDQRRQKKIARDFGISQASVSMIKNGVVWGHVQ